MDKVIKGLTIILSAEIIVVVEWRVRTLKACDNYNPR